MSMVIPYTVEARRDTGVYNGKLGIWLFLASEIMLFGGLFSAYVMLRTGAPEWPKGSELLNVPLATINTVILIVSGITMVFAWTSLLLDRPEKFRVYALATALLGLAFLCIKSLEYYEKVDHGLLPSTNNFYGIYFVLTGVHFLHIVGGVLALLWHAGPGLRLYRHAPGQFTNRVEITGLYWHFVDMVWLVLFPALYLV